ncbi:hypothetical protein MBLNU459_g2234t2 [Dothideomycetes sp. NU459]
MSAIEAVYIFNEHKSPAVQADQHCTDHRPRSTPILTHTFSARPPPAATVLPLYLAHAAPRPSCVYLPTTNPPSLLFSIVQDGLLFLCPSGREVEPLLVLEFLHRVADALEEFLGAPLLAARIEGSYDVVAQVLAEMCDAGLVAGTEANALRDVVDTPSWVGKLLGGVGLPGSSPALNPSSASGLSLNRPSLAPSLSTAGSQIPWRRSNVRHTSNELYVDIVETLSVTYAPSGRPLAAFANGSIAFTCKVSGVPDLLLSLTTGSGSGVGGSGDHVRRAMQRPVFHPCVRLARWRERGELSFVPPDGRFVLAGYDADLLDASAQDPLAAAPKDLNLPASLEVRTGLGAAGADFEVRLLVHPRALGGSSSSSSGIGGGHAAASLSTHLGRPGGGLRTQSGGGGGIGGGGSGGDSKTPMLEDVTVLVPIPGSVRNITDLRPSKGEAHWSPGDAAVEWKISGKEAASIGGAGAVLRCSVAGAPDDDDNALGVTNGLKADTYDYEDENVGGAYQSASAAAAKGASAEERDGGARDARRARQNAMLMPSSATLGFSVKGWLASGLRVDSLTIDTKRSKGLGEGVRPYKGVKYLTVSRGGIEVRC